MEMIAKKNKREELRITNPPKELIKKIKSLANKEKRTIPMQMEYMLEKYLETIK